MLMRLFTAAHTYVYVCKAAASEINFMHIGVICYTCSACYFI